MPVDQEFPGASVSGTPPVLNARVIESPSEAMEFGYPVRFGGGPSEEATEDNEAGQGAPEGPMHHPLSHLPKARPSRDSIAEDLPFRGCERLPRA